MCEIGLGFAGRAEAARAAVRGFKIIHDIHLHLHHRHNDQLSDSFHRFNRKGGRSAVPSGNHEFALVVGVD